MINAFVSLNVGLEIALQLFLAVLFSGIIGFEREYYGRPAGLRTHIMVALGSALIMIISVHGFESGDPARLAAQVVSGVGFLGAGAILRNGEDIKGLTTAATLWISSAIGLACGNGSYFEAFLTTAIVVVVLIILRNVDVVLNKSRPTVTLIVDGDLPITKQILSLITRYSLNIHALKTNLITFENQDCLQINITFHRGSDPSNVQAFAEDLAKSNELKRISVKAK